MEGNNCLRTAIHRFLPDQDLVRCSLDVIPKSATTILCPPLPPLSIQNDPRNNRPTNAFFHL
jgi:hypothetical protein